jgi:signal transduction histidine kinase
MHTAVKSTPIGKKQLPAGCALPQIKSFLLEQATQGAGRTLYEVLGMAELMRVAYEKGELESLQQRLCMLLTEAAGLSSTLSNIIELSRLEADASEPAFREFDVAAILHDVARTVRAQVGNKPVTVMEPAAPGPLVVFSDPRKVRQIMSEVAGNAARFTLRGRIALILCKDEERLRLMVTDTGKGMTAEELHRAFGSGNDPSSLEDLSATGTGLGITIVKRLVNSLGGTVAASSKPGEGTIVEVVLPVVQNMGQHAMDNRAHAQGIVERDETVAFPHC